MNSLKNKRVAVFGLGVSGIGALKLLSHLEAKVVAINTGDPKEWSKTQGVLDYLSVSDCFDEASQNLETVLNEIDLLVLSPGIPRDHRLVAKVLKRNVPAWGEIELSYRVLKENNLLSPIVGITGTNGKTTTTTLLGEMIQKDNKNVFVGGNIGIPLSSYAFDLLTHKVEEKVDYIVLELSSFQLESIEEFKVDIALMLNLYQNHGERYAQIEDYARSKMLITNKFNEESYLIISDQSPIISNWAHSIQGRKIIISNSHPDIKYDLSEFKLPGIHNKINLAFALKVAELIKLNELAIKECIKSFSGVHHRIEAVLEKGNLCRFKVFNDAKSTNWDATLTAVSAMEEYNSDIFLILGGKKRGHGDSIKPYFDFFKEHVRFFYLIGEMGNEIEKEFLELGLSRDRFLNIKTLEAAVLDVRDYRAQEEGNKVLLFSPAFPSFDQFNNYAHRGEVFKAALKK